MYNKLLLIIHPS